MSCNGIGMHFCHCGGDICICGIDGTLCQGCEDCDHLNEPEVCSFCEGISPDPSSCDCGYVEYMANVNTAEIEEIPF